MTETSDHDALEIGRAVHQSIVALLRHSNFAFSASPIDVMHDAGIRRAFVIVTLDENVVRFLEQAQLQAVEQIRRQQEGDHVQDS